MKSKTKQLVCGVGINDADYTTQVFQYMGRLNGKILSKKLWTCPYYERWRSLLSRCYSYTRQKLYLTYSDCFVCDEWLTFSNFKAWMDTQDWEGKQLDKDILFHGNRIYSPETCVFITREVNVFITERTAARGQYLIGVSWKEKNGMFQANVKNPFTKKKEYLGLFETESQAHNAWLNRKLELAKLLAVKQNDPRVAKALIERYENYGKLNTKSQIGEGQ